MRRSFFIKIMPFVVGSLLIPATIHAKSDRTGPIVPGVERPYECRRDSSLRHSFVVKLKEEASTIFGKMKSAITGGGGSLIGDKEFGSFEGKSFLGMIKGEYRSISGNEIEITIKQKPFLVSYNRIESEIRKYLA